MITIESRPDGVWLSAETESGVKVSHCLTGIVERAEVGDRFIPAATAQAFIELMGENTKVKLIPLAQVGEEAGK